jgi:hypothetical protein
MTKLFVSTTMTQGNRDSDFSFTTTGEPVTKPILICHSGASSIDGGCGCQRAFSGVVSRKGTTTAAVIDVDLPFALLVEFMLKRDMKAMGVDRPEGEFYDALLENIEESLNYADSFDVNDVVEIRDDVIFVRGSADEFAPNSSEIPNSAASVKAMMGNQ